VTKEDLIRATSASEALVPSDPHDERAVHARQMCERILETFIPEGLLDKANRWLGFVQGYLWTCGRASVSELRAINEGTGLPIYKHDCSVCVYLGHFTAQMPWREQHETWDLYTCDKAGYRTFIYRHGNDGPEYGSVPEMVVRELQGPHPALFECVRRARERGL
jgi:hypothetical protein